MNIDYIITVLYLFKTVKKFFLLCITFVRFKTKDENRFQYSAFALLTPPSKLKMHQNRN